MKKCLYFVLLLILLPINVYAADCSEVLNSGFISCKYEVITDNCHLTFSVINDKGKFTFADVQKKPDGSGCKYDYENFSEKDLVNDSCTLACPKVSVKWPYESETDSEVVTVKPDSNGHISAIETDIRYDYEEEVTYSASFDSNYDYGNLYSCKNICEDTEDIIGSKTINGKSVCVVKNECVLKNYNANCQNPEMEKYELNVTASNNEALKGWTCRKLKKNSSGGNSSGDSEVIPFTPAEEIDKCTSLLGDPNEDYTPAFYLNKAFQIIKYAGIVILIVMSVVDFVTATASNDQDAIQKAVKKTLIRLVFCVIIFLLPYLIKFILKYLNDRAIDLCGIE